MAKLNVMNSHCNFVNTPKSMYEEIRIAYDRVEASKGGSDGETTESGLGDGTVDNSLVAEAI